MSSVGVMVDNFSVPVCNSFKAKILNDQLCYEVDLNRFSDKNNVNRELKLGFYFLMDYNEDRQIIFNKISSSKTKYIGLANGITELDNNQHAFIYLDTIGIRL